MWRVTGRDPFLIYHDLDDHFMPRGGGEPMLPPYPSRQQAVLYEFGNYSFKTDLRLAGGNPNKRQPIPREQREQR